MKRKKLWGLFQLRKKWTLTFKGKMFVILLVIAFLGLILTNIHGFLAPIAPIEADILVVEGWIPDEGIEGAITEFKSKNYQQLITTGSPLGKGFYLSEYKNFAELSAATIMAIGFDAEKLAAVPAPKVERDRTAASGMALKNWLKTSDLKVDSLNIYTFDVHTRRSWLIYKKIFAPGIKVGAIAHKSSEYSHHSWWRYSAGVRSILSEAIAYLYALVWSLTQY